MYEALIEKIRAERVPEGSNYDYIVNGTIDEIIEVIKASEPQWLDSPNEEGWWWQKWCNPKLEKFNSINGCVKVIENNFGNLEVENNFGNLEVENGLDIYLIRYSFFKWVKALTP
jgi:hypothetical protein